MKPIDVFLKYFNIGLLKKLREHQKKSNKLKKQLKELEELEIKK